MHPLEQVDVYGLQVPADFNVVELTPALYLLDPEEREVYNRYRVDSKKIEFLLGRALLKTQIGSRLGRDPESVHFVKNDYGKLFLADAAAPAFHFNLTHSGSVIACAFAPMTVGVDVEYAGNDHLSVMPTVFTAEEQAYVHSREPDERLQAFYRIWTRKEAYVKAVGMGLSISPDSFGVPIEEMGEGEWAYYTCRPADSYVLSLAVSSQGHAPSETVHPNLHAVDARRLLRSL
ncbi:4'-phosphopantetheinyl transferase family protein [Tumebacillus flagellatus]|uniref:Uncharacterized protein n=1 Tax=Tumebacillus flagellatus TaxID=1157490 RepID=A0A074LYT1_9BACL|nr:4'-phosphopantetheinyl transferase superfamily protein [Tumebacillus flagellatus]KEO85183.1 hypothetical protein EL26_01090 [Tumebacillus flagellatus]